MTRLMNSFFASARLGAAIANVGWIMVLGICVVVLIIRAGGRPTDGDVLYWALSSANVREFEEVTARMSDLNARDDLGFTPLAVAANFGRRDAVEMLLSRGAAVDVGHPELGTPLMLALARGHTGVASVLLAHGADVHVRYQGFDPLSCAVCSNNLDCLELILEAGADPRAAGRRCNLLTLAAQPGDTKVLQQLLDAGVDPDLPDADGTTPLFHAIESGATEAAILLLKAGADFERVCPDGRTPFELAAALQRIEILEVLIPSHRRQSLAVPQR